jgi:transcriptional regulator with XRE-family HTH domain
MKNSFGEKSDGQRFMKKVKSKSAIDEYIGLRMREIRLSLNMSQEHLAKALGVSFQQIQNYEKGANGVSAVRLFEICNVLNVSLSSMFPSHVNMEHSETAHRAPEILQYLRSGNL